MGLGFPGPVAMSGCYGLTGEPNTWEVLGSEDVSAGMRRLGKVSAATRIQAIQDPLELRLTVAGRSLGEYQYEHVAFYGIAEWIQAGLGRLLCEASQARSGSRIKSQRMGGEAVASVFNTMLGVIDTDRLPLRLVLDTQRGVIQGRWVQGHTRSFTQFIEQRHEILRPYETSLYRIRVHGPTIQMDHLLGSYPQTLGFRPAITMVDDLSSHYQTPVSFYGLIRKDGVRIRLPSMAIDHRGSRLKLLKKQLDAKKSTAILFADSRRALEQLKRIKLRETATSLENLQRYARKSLTPGLASSLIPLVSNAVWSIAADRDIDTMDEALSVLTWFDFLNGWLSVAKDQSPVLRYQAESSAWTLLPISQNWRN